MKELPHGSRNTSVATRHSPSDHSYRLAARRPARLMHGNRVRGRSTSRSNSDRAFKCEKCGGRLLWCQTLRPVISWRQLLDPEGSQLRLLGWKGFHPQSAIFWDRVHFQQRPPDFAARSLPELSFFFHHLHRTHVLPASVRPGRNLRAGRFEAWPRKPGRVPDHCMINTAWLPQPGTGAGAGASIFGRRSIRTH
jgi:hypothetical protein